MRNLRPPQRGRGKDGEAAKKSPRTTALQVNQLEWVEEDPNCECVVFRPLGITCLQKLTQIPWFSWC